MKAPMPASFRLASRPVFSPPPPRRREPYTVERFPTIEGGVLLIGYDGRGEVMLELRVSRHRFNERMIPRMRQWMMRNDDDMPMLAAVR